MKGSEKDMRYKFLLFDADNTLFDFSACEAKAFSLALQKCGIREQEGMAQVYSAYNDECWKMHERGELSKAEIVHRRYAKFLEHYGLTYDPDELNGAYVGFLSETAIELPGAKELLARLYGRAKIYVITNGLTKVQKGRFARSELTKYVDDVFISEEMGVNKPDARFFEEAEKRIPGFEKRDAVVIGDSLTSDIKGANNAGLDCVWFNPKREKNDSGLCIKATVSDFDELEAYLTSEDFV